MKENGDKKKISDKICMNIFRYYITNNNNDGTLISGKINGKKMLMILKGLIKSKPDINVNEIVKVIIETYDFSIIKKNLSFIDLNQSQDTPYTFYHLIDDGGYVEDDGYMYANIQEIKKYFSIQEKTNQKANSSFLKKTFS